MKDLGITAMVAAALVTGPLEAAPTGSAATVTPDGARQDVRCFMLFAAAVNQAAQAGNDKARQASGAGVMYFYTKLFVEAPSLNLPRAVKQQAEEFVGNPRSKEYAAACDAELQQRGKELIIIGQELQNMGKAEGQSSSSS